MFPLMAFMVFNPYAVDNYLTSFTRCFKKTQNFGNGTHKRQFMKAFKKVVISQRLENTNSNLKGLGSSSSQFF